MKPRSISLLCVLFLAASPALAQEGADWQSLPEALAVAAHDGCPVLVYVQAAWCGPCRRMERDVFPAVEPLLGRFALARLDFDDRETRLELNGRVRAPAEWAAWLGVDATPGFALLSPGGAVVSRSVGYLDADAFARALAYVATGAYRHAAFEEYLSASGW